MSKEEMVEDQTGPTCLYKKGEARVFGGAGVAKAMRNGWKDTPSDAPALVKETG